MVRRSLHQWWWVVLVTIAGSMPAIAGASDRELGGERGCAVAHSITPVSFGAPFGEFIRSRQGADCDDWSAHRASGSGCLFRVRDRGPHLQLARAVRFRASGEQSHCHGHPRRAPVAVRVVSHPRVRITRLHNGSVLCWRELGSAHVVVVPSDINDDTASDGDDRSDDDDSWDDLNGDDDTESPAIAWVQVMVLYLVAPECVPVSPWFVPSFPPFVTLERLRC